MQQRGIPGPGQESVWDYPRPPRLELTARRLRVESAGVVIAQTAGAYRVLETSHPPNWYLARSDVRLELLARSPKSATLCEWKGLATYWNLESEDSVIENAAWSYENPNRPFAAIRSYLSFYPNLVECYVDDERVQPQAGGFYGGWITSDIVGPFKGTQGTSHW